MKACPFCAENIQNAAIKCRFCGERLAQAGVVSPLPSEDEMISQDFRVGNFRLIAHLGTGGMGSVFVAEHPDIGKRVAVKIMRSDLTANPESLDRFLNEAKTVVRLHHPSIVDVLDYGILDTGQRYLVMEHLDGQDLQVYRRSRRRLSPHEAAGIVWQILDALAAAHAADVIHRDLKPENIFVIPWGRRSLVKLLDFGIAKLLGETDPNERKTQTGVILGTPAYMAPEQAAGRRDLDGRTDLYSVGILLYELVVGRRPFHSPNPGELLLMQQSSPPPPPRIFVPKIPPLLEELILKCLEKDPEKRSLSASELRDELQGLFTSLPRAALDLSEGAFSKGDVSGETLVDAKAWALQAADPKSVEKKQENQEKKEDTPESIVLEEDLRPKKSSEKKPKEDPLSAPPELVAESAKQSSSRIQTTLSQSSGEVEQALFPPERRPQRRLLFFVPIMAGLGLLLATIIYFSTNQGTKNPSISTAIMPSRVLIRLESVPSGAKIFVPDQVPPLGETPKDIQVPSEGRKIILKSKGFLERELFLKPGDSPSLSVELVPVKAE